MEPDSQATHCQRAYVAVNDSHPLASGNRRGVHFQRRFVALIALTSRLLYCLCAVSVAAPKRGKLDRHQQTGVQQGHKLLLIAQGCTRPFRHLGGLWMEQVTYERERGFRC